MENSFKSIANDLFSQLSSNEYLTLSLSAEKSQFIRFNNAKIRQTGIINDSILEFSYIANNRRCSGSITLSNNFNIDKLRADNELGRMRVESKQILEDPYIVLPKNIGSTHSVLSQQGLAFEQAADLILPAISGVDFVGILANGKLYRGNMNSLGQKHWFETESHCLDYSLVAKNHQMVKGTFAGTDWVQSEFLKQIDDSKIKLELMNKKPIKINKGNYRTWFEPAAVADFIGMFSWNGISESSIQQGCSGFGKMRNNDIRLSSKFSIAENFKNGLVPKFNSNGEPAPENLDLINKGKLTNTLVSSRSAAEYGSISNNAESGEYLRSPKMAPGILSGNDILNQIDKGLYLSNIHYLNWSDNPGGRITGLTRYACFWVERGEIVAPIQTMRFDDTFYNFFGNKLEEVGSEVKFIPEVGTYGNRNLGGTTCPGILTDSFSLTL